MELPTNQAPVLASPAAQSVVWRVAGAAAPGISHQRSGLPCQDAQASRVLPDGTLLVALADGAGSAQFSDRGAQRAVQTALDFMTAELEQSQAPDWEVYLRGAFQAARDAVLRLAVGPETGDRADLIPARAYACTLTCVVATLDLLAVGQVGDGAVVAGGMDGEEALFTITRLQRGEYANETHFLVQEDALEQLMIDVVDRPAGRLAVMSDGLIRLALKMPSQEPHTPFFEPLFRFAGSITEESDAGEQLTRFLNSERVNARTDDDKSLVLAVRDTLLPAGSSRNKSKPGEAKDPPDRVEE